MFSTISRHVQGISVNIVEYFTSLTLCEGQDQTKVEIVILNTRNFEYIDKTGEYAKITHFF